jgi:hypothetical protein
MILLNNLSSLTLLAVMVLLVLALVKAWREVRKGRDE